MHFASVLLAASAVASAAAYYAPSELHARDAAPFCYDFNDDTAFDGLFARNADILDAIEGVLLQRRGGGQSKEKAKDIPRQGRGQGPLSEEPIR